MLKNKRPTWCHLLFYFTSYVLNMFRTLIYPPSGACDYSVELSHWSYCSWLDVCWSFGVVGLEWYPCCRLKHDWSVHVECGGWGLINPQPPHSKNNTANVLIQQNSRKLLMMDILMSETCWAHKKWNKIASDIKLVFYSSTITMMYGPIKIRFYRQIEWAAFWPPLACVITYVSLGLPLLIFKIQSHCYFSTFTFIYVFINAETIRHFDVNFVRTTDVEKNINF